MHACFGVFSSLWFACMCVLMFCALHVWFGLCFLICGLPVRCCSCFVCCMCVFGLSYFYWVVCVSVLMFCLFCGLYVFLFVNV